MSLEGRYRNAHLQLTVWCSEGGVQNPDAKGGGKPGDRILFDFRADGRDELSEQSVRVFERRWAAAVTDEHRLAVVEDMEAEVARLRYPEPQERPAETELERRARILKDTEGWSPDDVARSRHGVTAREIMRWRKQDGTDPQTGRTHARPDRFQRFQQVQVLVAEGITSPAEIARRLGEPNKWGVLRDLRKLKDEEQAA